MIAERQWTSESLSEISEARFESRPARIPGNGPFQRILIWFREELEFHVPVAYEDETGFHYGCEPLPAAVDHDLVA